jgi:signal transduction histidine kinase
MTVNKNYFHGGSKKDVKISYQGQKDSFEVEADKARIIQVISNILSNAIKFSPQHGGTISISLEKEIDGDDDDDDDDGKANRVIVSIKDNGPGIDSELFPKLFSRFTSKSFSGTGLGLFISKNIIEAHGGRIWAQNNHDGEKGATFSFSLLLRE